VNTLAERSDTGLGRRFAADYGARVRYVHLWGDWLVYERGRWARDAMQRVRMFAKALAMELGEEAASEPDEERRKVKLRFAAECLDNRKQRALLEAAQSEPPIAAHPDDFDRDPLLFNCANTTLELRTGAPRPHDPADMITMQSPVTFDAAAECPTWRAHLDRTFGGCTDTIGFMQRWGGYTLTGDTREQLFTIEAGPPATGKSATREALRGVMGDYGVVLSMDALMARQHAATGAARPDLAKLRGKRAAAAVETGAGRRFDEPLIKLIVGGDPLTARQIYQEECTFLPMFKLCISTNYIPLVSTDPAMWRRIAVIPYLSPIPEAERDQGLGARLRAEGPGILNWLLSGCLEWQRAGLAVPGAVRAATAAERARLDGLGGFLAERCIRRDGSRAKTADLYADYLVWAVNGGTDAVNKTHFARMLSDHGIPSGKASGTRLGIRLRTPEDPPEGDAEELEELVTKTSSIRVQGEVLVTSSSSSSLAPLPGDPASLTDSQLLDAMLQGRAP